MTSDGATTRDPIDPLVLQELLGTARWFGGKGRDFAVTDVRQLGEVPGRVEDGPRSFIHLVEVTYSDTGDQELYQVPLVFYRDPEKRLDHAFVGWWEDPELGWVHAYDALHDREAMGCWLRSFDTQPDGPLQFRRVPGHDLDLTVHSALFSGEQSNSSVAFGEDSILKVFRKVTPGLNPDVAIHEVLTAAGSDHVAALYGWLETAAGDDVLQLAVLQQFLRTASDGWELALTSVRNLFSEADLMADEVGGDFAAEAERLGIALAEVHADLRTALGSATSPAGSIAEAMANRLNAAVAVVPALAEHADALQATYHRLGLLGDLVVQRVHGDLHLGQTLRTVKGWKIVDFEGEPAKPLAERLRPDAPWRDVAGMLRSFDYAAHSVDRGRDSLQQSIGEKEQRAFRATEWVSRNCGAFLTSYVGRDLTDEERLLLGAYVADKAVYECVYELSLIHI